MRTKIPLLLLVAMSLALAQSDVEAGRARYRIYCAECHGREGRGGRGPDLVSGRWTHGGADEDLMRTITKGVEGAGMPAFSESFEPGDIRQLVAFIRALESRATPAKVTGDVGRGRELYWGQANCGSCHMVAGRGGRLGPELTRIGAQRSLAHLKESIVSPSADIAPGYQAVRAAPRRGASVVGIRRNEDNFTIQVFDTSEKYHSFQKADLEKLEELKDSLMPKSTLTEAEVDDLVAYLDTLRGKS